MKRKETINKPIIETIINSAALALFAYGTAQIIAENYYGVVVVAFGAALEFYKYWGRKESYW